MSGSVAPVGERLFAALSHDASKVYSAQELGIIGGLVDEAINVVSTYRTKNKFSNLKTSALVTGLFKSFEKADDRERLRLTAQCAEEFLHWCKGEIEAGNSGVCQMLLNFTYDTAYIGYLGAAFCTHYAGHSHFWIPVDSYAQVFNWFRGGSAPERLTSEFMCIFELRQAMETAFHRVIGIGEISVPIRIPHGLIPDILHRNLTTKNFSPPSGLTIKEFMHVYDWTDRSIHLMCTDWTWVVWKAMMIGCDFFYCPERKNGRISIHDNFELTDELLKSLRHEFIQRVSKYNFRFKKFKVHWNPPDAAIVGKDGKSINVSASDEEVECVLPFGQRIKKLVAQVTNGCRDFFRKGCA